MEHYKGISRVDSPDLWNYIDSFYFVARKRPNESILEKDKSLQKLVKRHYLKKKLFIVLFNLMPYLSFYSIILILN